MACATPAMRIRDTRVMLPMSTAGADIIVASSGSVAAASSATATATAVGAVVHVDVVTASVAADNTLECPLLPGVDCTQFVCVCVSAA